MVVRTIRVFAETVTYYELLVLLYDPIASSYPNLPEVKLLIKHSYRSDIALVVSQPFKKRIVENQL